MFFKASFVLFLFALVFLPSNATEAPAEIYWKAKFGNIPMPKVIKDSLELDGVTTAKINTQYQVTLDARDSMNFYAHPNLDSQDVEINYVPDDRVVYFTQEKFIVGTKIKLHFRKVNDGAKFLPLYIAKSMDFAQNKLQMILNILSVNPNSTIAQYIEKTIKDCEEKGVKDETRYCATSLEAIVDIVTLTLGSKKQKLMAVSTEQDKDVVMNFLIQKAEKLGNNDNQTMVCHKLGNPYVVFLCHNIKSTDTYGVSLIDSNGKQMKAIAVCHKDTSSWYPGHLAFKILKIEPGSKPICHFLSGDTIVWLQN